MWWQVRYDEQKDKMICYKDKDSDIETDPLLKTIVWADSTLKYPIIKSIGADFIHGGYGTKKIMDGMVLKSRMDRLHC
ncbi:MAG: hypothetical protein QM734_02100 [Cyclobacteriaceae bacterium]